MGVNSLPDVVNSLPSSPTHHHHYSLPKQHHKVIMELFAGDEEDKEARLQGLLFNGLAADVED